MYRLTNACIKHSHRFVCAYTHNHIVGCPADAKHFALAMLESPNWCRRGTCIPQADVTIVRAGNQGVIDGGMEFDVMHKA